MSTAIIQDSSRLNLIFMIFSMLFLLVFVAMVVRQPDVVRADIEVELTNSKQLLGVQEQYLLETTTKQRFQSWYYDSGLYDSIYNMLAPKRQSEAMEEWQKKGSNNFLSEGWIWRFLENFQLYGYQFTHRITMVEFWLTTMIPMMICIVVTGYYTWRIKQYQLTGQSTAKVRLWLKALWFSLLLFSIYLVTPNLIGIYTLYAPPVLLVLVSLSVALVIASFSKEI